MVRCGTAGTPEKICIGISIVRGTGFLYNKSSDLL